MAYGGDSNSKRLARFHFWVKVASKLQWEDDPARAKRSRVLVLSGPEAADVRALGALNVPPQNVVAVDKDASAIAEAKKLVPDANYICDDVLKVVQQKKYRHSFDAILLDHCCPMSQRAILRSVRVGAFGLRHGGILGAGFMYGREGPEARKTMKGYRNYHEVLALLEQSVSDEELVEAFNELPEEERRYYEHSSEYVEDQRRIVAKCYSPTMIAQYTRSNYACAKFADAALQLGRIAVPMAFYYYRSGRRSDGLSKGVPMVYSQWAFERPFRTVSRRVMRRNERRRLRAALEHDEFDVLSLGDDPDGHVLRSRAVDLARAFGSARTAEIFNLDKGQVAAWLAWNTRTKLRWEETEPLDDEEYTCPICGQLQMLMLEWEYRRELLDKTGFVVDGESRCGANSRARCPRCGYQGVYEEFNPAMAKRAVENHALEGE